MVPEPRAWWAADFGGQKCLVHKKAQTKKKVEEEAAVAKAKAEADSWKKAEEEATIAKAKAEEEAAAKAKAEAVAKKRAKEEVAVAKAKTEGRQIRSYTRTIVQADGSRTREQLTDFAERYNNNLEADREVAARRHEELLGAMISPPPTKRRKGLQRLPRRCRR